MKKLFFIWCVIAATLSFVSCETDELGGNYGRVMLDGVNIAGVWVNVEEPDDVEWYWAITDGSIEYYESNKSVSYKNGYLYGDAEWTLEQYHEYELIGNTLYVQGIKMAVLDVIDKNTVKMESNWLVSGTCKRVKGFKDAVKEDEKKEEEEEVTGDDKPTTENFIKFQDEKTKALCLTYWDENKDGELSYDEAEAITDIGTVFKESAIETFNEFAYFKGVSVIPTKAFYHCEALTSVTIPDSVTKIGEAAFKECFKLTEVVIPNSVETIGYMAFAYSRNIKYIKFPDGDYTIGDGPTFGCSALQQMTGKYTTADKLSLIKDGELISIATGNITTYNVPDEVVTIRQYVYRGRISSTNPDGWLSSFTGKFATPDGKCLVEDNILKAVAGKNIGDFTIPDGVTRTTFGILYGCHDLTSVTIPKSVKSIGGTAFKDCKKLQAIYCKPTTPPSLGNGNVFTNNASGRKIYVPTASVDAYKAATNWSSYASAIEPYTFTE